jgi:hypothetical protein
MPGCSAVIIVIIVFIVSLKAKSWDTAIMYGGIILLGIIFGEIDRREKKNKKNGN